MIGAAKRRGALQNDLATALGVENRNFFYVVKVQPFSALFAFGSLVLLLRQALPRQLPLTPSWPGTREDPLSIAACLNLVAPLALPPYLYSCWSSAAWWSSTR